MTNTKKTKGFTLIEILVVVALIAILAAVTIVAINPAKNFADTRNAQRSSDVKAILDAVTQYLATAGNTLGGLGTIPACSSTPAAIGTGSGNVNLAGTLVSDYIAAIPIDPSGGTAANTGYTICTTASNRIQIAAPNAENGKTVSVQR